MADNILTLTDDAFDTQVLKSDTLTLVDFWAEWCAPCRAIAPVVENLAQSYQGRLQVGKMNIDENPNTPSKYSVRAIPTLLFFKNGEVVDQIVGLANKAKIEEVVKKHT